MWDWGYLVSAIGAFLLFLLVLAGAYFATRWIGRHYSAVGGGSANLKVLERLNIGKESALMIVEAAGKTFLAGCTPHSIQILCELDPQELQQPQPPGMAGTPDFAAILKRFENRLHGDPQEGITPRQENAPEEKPKRWKK